MTWWWFTWGFLVVAALFAVWFAYEVITAPLLDEDGRVIEDKYGRMSDGGRGLRFPWEG